MGEKAVAELDGQVLVEVNAHESRHFVSGLFVGCRVLLRGRCEHKRGNSPKQSLEIAILCS